MEFFLDFIAFFGYFIAALVVIVLYACAAACIAMPAIKFAIDKGEKIFSSSKRNNLDA